MKLQHLPYDLQLGILDSVLNFDKGIDGLGYFDTRTWMIDWLFGCRGLLDVGRTLLYRKIQIRTQDEALLLGETFSSEAQLADLCVDLCLEPLPENSWAANADHLPKRGVVSSETMVNLLVNSSRLQYLSISDQAWTDVIHASLKAASNESLKKLQLTRINVHSKSLAILSLHDYNRFPNLEALGFTEESHAPSAGPYGESHDSNPVDPFALRQLVSVIDLCRTKEQIASVWPRLHTFHIHKTDWTVHKVNLELPVLSGTLNKLSLTIPSNTLWAIERNFSKVLPGLKHFAFEPADVGDPKEYVPTWFDSLRRILAATSHLLHLTVRCDFIPFDLIDYLPPSLLHLTLLDCSMEATQLESGMHNLSLRRLAHRIKARAIDRLFTLTYEPTAHILVPIKGASSNPKSSDEGLLGMADEHMVRFRRLEKRCQAKSIGLKSEVMQELNEECEKLDNALEMLHNLTTPTT